MTRVRRGASILGWALCAAVVVVLWPAQYGGWLTLTIVSGQSMEPTYRSGDLVVAWRVPDYRPGDAVVYTVPDDAVGAGHRIIHRLLSEADGRWTTQGDNKSTADPWNPGDSDILGRAWFHVPGAGVGIVTWAPIALAFVAGGLITAALWPRRRRRHRAEPPERAAGAGPAVAVLLVVAVATGGRVAAPASAASLGGLAVEPITAWSDTTLPIVPDPSASEDVADPTVDGPEDALTPDIR